MTINVAMTAKEHYALTALLRSGVTIGGTDKLGLRGLLERLGQPYKDELMSRGLDTLAALNYLPTLSVIDGSPIHIQVPIEQQHDSVFVSANPLEWYRWPGELDTAPTAEARLNKLLGWMSSNVKEGWDEVCRIAAVATYVSYEEAVVYLDQLPACSVGLCAGADSGGEPV